MADLYDPIGGDAEQAAREIAALRNARERLQAEEMRRQQQLAAGALQEEKRTTARKAATERRAVDQRRINAGLAEEASLQRKLADEERRRLDQTRRHRPPPPTRPAPGIALVPRTPEAGAVGGPMYGQYPYAPQPRYQEVPRRIEERGTAQRPETVRATAQEVARANAVVTQATQMHRLYQVEAMGAAAADQQLARQRSGVAGATRLAALEAQRSSQVMRKHGALTSEFIAAAARGETTFSEMRYQMTATIGKFAGWTAAAGFIYGALDAVRSLGRGAIEAQSGVQQLHRVVTEDFNEQTASQGIRDLAREFNVPIEVAADAAYRMGQIFHSQPEALEAARAALYSFKTGEVDVASSTSSLTAIVTGFGLSSSQLVNVFDQINEAQNKFGIGIADTEAGLAKAAGTWRNAGGELDYLLALFVAIQRSTRRSGQEIGTGLSRSQNFLRQPANLAMLEAEGVEVNLQDIEATYQSAMEAAQRPGADLRNIAVGLLGPQYARLIESTLKDQTTLNEAIGDTAPERSKGSAQRELARVLSESRERLKEVGISLELIGAALYEAGFFDILGLGLITLNHMLRAIEAMTSLVAGLPEPFRQMVVYGTQMLAVFAAMRRFGGFQGTAVTRAPGLGFLDNTDARMKKQIESGLRAQLQYAQNERETYGTQAFGHAMRAEAETLRADEIRAQQIARFAGEEQAEAYRRAIADAPDPVAARAVREQHSTRAFGGIAPQLRYELDTEYNRVAGEALKAEDERTRAMQRATSTTQVVRRTEEELAEAQRTRARDIRGFAQRRGYYAPATAGIPTTMPLLGPDDLGPPAAQRGVRPGSLTARWQTAARVRIADTAVRLRDLNNTTAAIGTMERAAMGGVNVVARGTSAAGRAAASVRSLPGRLRASTRSLLGQLGTLDKIFLGISAAFLAYEGITAIVNNMESQRSDIRMLGPGTPALGTGSYIPTRDIQARVDKAREETYQQQGLIDNAWERLVSEFESGPSGMPDIGPLKGHDYKPPAYVVAEQEVADLEALRQQQQAARAAGAPVPQRILREIARAQERDIESYREGTIGFQKLRESRERALSEIAMSQNVTGLAALREELREARLEGKDQEEIAELETQVAQQEAAIRDARRQARARVRAAIAASQRTAGDDGGGMAALWRGAPVEEISQRLGAMFGRFETFGASGRDIRSVTQGYQAAVARIGQSGKPEDITNLNSAREQYLNGLRTVAEAEIERGLATATSPAEIQAVYQRGRQHLQRARAEARRGVQRAQREQEEQRQAMVEARRAIAFDFASSLQQGVLGFAIGQGARAAFQRARGAFRRARSRARTQAEEFKAIQQEISRMMQEIIDTPALESGQNYRQVAARARTSATVDQGDDLRADLANLDNAVSQAVANFGADHLKTLELIAERNEKLHELFAYETEIADALGRLRVARAGGGQAGMRASLDEARRALARAQANPSEYTRAQIIDLQTAVVEAENAMADDVSRRAASMFDLRASRTRSPIRKARLMVEKARYVVAHNPDDPIQAMIDLENAKTELSEALFERDMARLELWANRTEDSSKQAYRNLVIARRRLRRAPRGTAEYFQALQEVRERERGRRDALAQDRLENMEFHSEMNDWTNDALIAGYNRILQTMELSKDMRRDIKLKIKRLKDELENEAGLDMEVGNIRLPTVYEIRRAIGAGTSQDRPRQTYISIHNQNHLRVERTADAGAVISELDHAIGTSLSTAYRMTGA